MSKISLYSYSKIFHILFLLMEKSCQTEITCKITNIHVLCFLSLSYYFTSINLCHLFLQLEWDQAYYHNLGPHVEVFTWLVSGYRSPFCSYSLWHIVLNVVWDEISMNPSSYYDWLFFCGFPHSLSIHARIVPYWAMVSFQYLTVVLQNHKREDLKCLSSYRYETMIGYWLVKYLKENAILWILRTLCCISVWYMRLMTTVELEKEV
jgi:hypothetical protein